MRIAIDKTLLVAAEPFVLKVTDDGASTFTICKDGVRVHVAMTAEESRGLGTQLIENGAVARLLREQNAAIAKLAPPIGDNGGGLRR